VALRGGAVTEAYSNGVDSQGFMSSILKGIGTVA